MLMLLGRPSFIFAIVNCSDHMMEGAPNGSLVLVTPSGWMASELFPEVFKHFIKHMYFSKNNPAVLVMDNHESDLTIDIAKKNEIIILTFASLQT